MTSEKDLLTKTEQLAEIRRAAAKVISPNSIGPDFDMARHVALFVVVVCFVGGLGYTAEVAKNTDDALLMLGTVISFVFGLTAALGFIIRRATQHRATWPDVLTERMGAYKPVGAESWNKLEALADAQGNIPLDAIQDWIKKEIEEVDRLYAKLTSPRVKLPSLQ